MNRVLNSLISVLYLRVIVYMTMREADRPLPALNFSAPTKFALGVSDLGTVFIGLFPSRLLSLAQQTLSALMGSFLQTPSRVSCKLA